MSAHFPELGVIYIGGYDFAVASYLVFRSHEFDEFVVDDGAVRVKQGAAGREGGEVKELVFRTNSSVIPLDQLLLLFNVFV
jgi:hypothetical protein